MSTLSSFIFIHSNTALFNVPQYPMDRELFSSHSEYSSLEFFNVLLLMQWRNIRNTGKRKTVAAVAASTKAFFVLEQHYGFEVIPISDLSLGSEEHFCWTHFRFFSEDAKPEPLGAHQICSAIELRV